MMAEHQIKHTETSGHNRRQFLNRFWAFLGLGALAEFGWLGMSFLNSRKERNQPAITESIVTAGTVEQFTPATVTAIPQGQFYLACLADGSFLSGSIRHLNRETGTVVIGDKDAESKV